jgi:molybdenum cofactor guanylyltransferase
LAAIILAGGQGSRVSFQDKGLLQWRDRALIDHVIARIHPHVENIVISANRHVTEYQQRGFPVVVDQPPDFAGPLAGIVSCLAHIDSEFVLTVPCDMPLLPSDLVQRLQHTIAQNNADCVVAFDGSYSQYLVALYRHKALLALPQALNEGVRAVRHWQQRIRAVTADFSDEAACFGNFNTLAQLN